MEKIVKLGGKEILLKATAMNLLIYQEQFGEDMFHAKGELIDVFGQKEIKYKDIPSVTVMKLFWTMAKTGNPDFPPFREWVESLDEFPVVELYNDNIELFLANMMTRSDIKN